MPALVDLAYLTAAVLFVVALKGLSHPRKAIRGNALGSLGMAIAVGATLLDARVVRFDLILTGVLTGSVFGVLLATRIRMTAMPELVALFNGLGGGASTLVAGSALVAAPSSPSSVALSSATVVSGLVGTVTFSGSLLAVLKLSGVVSDRRPGVLARGIPVALLGLGSVVLGVLVVLGARAAFFYALLVLVSTLLGLVLVAPIGGADMPVVISFLNACSGLAAAATGFVLMNQALIVSGSLVGASGLILTRIMCRAMNRPLTRVLFLPLRESGTTASAAGPDRPVKSAGVEEVAMMVEVAQRVVIVPGYGMAVAQAQFAVAELAKKLEARGVSVAFAVHPVAGRMPGHMNVLLAEADVPYDHLKDLDAINPEFPRCDVALVIGANDVVNPGARSDRKSPLYGMPILDVDRAASVVVFKRSLRPGFAGVENPLFTLPNTVMLFGDAKETVLALTEAIE